jgi:AraC family transcriptional regulator
MRRWKGIAPTMVQPPLDHHFAVLHLGGGKRVYRSGDGSKKIADVQPGGISVTPAGCGFVWHTEGPIDFAHLYVGPDQLDRAAIEWFDRDSASLSLRPAVGESDSLLSAVMSSMLEEAAQPGFASELYLDSLFDAFTIRLLIRFSNLQLTCHRARHALAPYRLRRVRDYVDSHLADSISLGSMAEVAGLSRFHFSRAFCHATGLPPAAYVARQRVDCAKRLLSESELPVADIAIQSGFSCHTSFCTAFRRATGTTPTAFRHRH